MNTVGDRPSIEARPDCSKPISGHNGLRTLRVCSVALRLPRSEEEHMSAASVDVYRAADRFSTTADGVESWHCFSFGEHYDPANTAHGPLIAHNDTIIQPGSGFPPHRHANVEIVSWVISGLLHHEDSTGQRADIGPGVVQRLSAGAGVVHTETAGGSTATRFVQMWVTPDRPGGRADYMQASIHAEALEDGLVVVTSGPHPERVDAPVSIHRQGAALLVGRLGPGQAARLPDADLLHVYVTSGSVTLAPRHTLEAGDSVRLTRASDLSVTGLRAAEILVWAMDTG
jgi:redox-sensitive bicupin YhaK (pirin superfamily)